MGWWKADPTPPQPSASSSSTQQTTSSPRPPLPAPLPDSSSSSSSCPVDPQTRSIWLRESQRQQKQQEKQQHQQESLSPPRPSPPPHPRSEAPPPNPPLYTTPHRPRPLSHTREISSIPRAYPSSSSSSPSSSTPPPSTPILHQTNIESLTTPHASPSGHWIYPSESQFLSALQRKHSLPPSSTFSSTLSSTIPTIIPLHNAVNERAWSLIRGWEGSTSASCGGPKLLSFRGQGTGFSAGGATSSSSTDDGEGPTLPRQFLNIVSPFSPLTPRARWKSAVGYQEPFDRHDWVVQRCDGREVEYVIDFYQGRSQSRSRGRGLTGDEKQGGGISFYLDVRPKLNSWEGWRLRFNRFWGAEV